MCAETKGKWTVGKYTYQNLRSAGLLRGCVETSEVVGLQRVDHEVMGADDAGISYKELSCDCFVR